MNGGSEAIAWRLGRTPGIAVEPYDAGRGRPSLIAVVGAGRGKPLMRNGHTGTDGVADMAAPFEPRLKDGWLYTAAHRRAVGRGAAAGGRGADIETIISGR